MSTGQAEVYSRWLRLAVRAYPRRWRKTRECELLGVVRDSNQGEQRQPGPRLLVNLTLSGWETRLRHHPPLVPWLAYRIARRPLSAQWNSWVADDLDGSLWWARSLAVAYVVIAVMASGTGFSLGFSAGGCIALLLIVTAVAFLGRHGRRRLARSKQFGVATMHAWVPAWSWQTPPVRKRVAPFLEASSWAFTAAGAVGAWLPTNSAAQAVGRRIGNGPKVVRLHHLAVVEPLAAGAGLVVAVALLALGYRRVPGRLATRQAGSVGVQRAPAWQAVAVGGTELVVGLFFFGFGWGPPVLIAASVGVGVPLLALARAATSSERDIAVDVTWRDCRQAMSSTTGSIEPELARWVAVPRLVPVEGPLPEFQSS